MLNFPHRGRGLGHVTPKIFGIQSNLSLKLLELENRDFKFGIQLHLGKAERALK